MTMTLLEMKLLCNCTVITRAEVEIYITNISGQYLCLIYNKNRSFGSHQVGHILASLMSI
jgi:hypothetical protein